MRAEEEGEAARLGAWEIEALDDDVTSMEDIGTVYVVRVTEGTWWAAIPDFVTQRAELQCCGGSKYTDHGHSGNCPVHRAQS